MDHAHVLGRQHRLELSESGLASLPSTPGGWDYIVHNNLIPLEAEAGRPIGRSGVPLLRYHQAVAEHLVARCGEGTLHYRPQFPEGLAYTAEAKLRLAVPHAALEFARRFEHDGLRVCVVLGGGAPAAHTPSVRSWIMILRGLVRAFPDLRST